MPKEEDTLRSSSGTAPKSGSTAASPPTSSKPYQPPKSQPSPPPGGGSAHKGLPPNAVIIKVSKSLTSVPSSTWNATSSSSSGAATTAQPPPAPVSVPAQCWYANPFTLSTNTPMTEFHRAMRGKVFFSPRAVPVTATELLSLPDEKPPQLTVCEVGKDLLYGVGYLYSTPLSVEHQWRGRVAHLLRVRSRQAPVPTIVRRRAEAVATAAQQKQHQQQQRLQQQANKEGKGGEKAVGSAQKPESSSPLDNTPAVVIDYLRTMCYERGEASVYDRPGDDFLIGVKLYVNNELVEDHYPIVNALPQCTATLVVKEAAQHWNCVPFVLMGYINQLMLDPICIYHALSLSFVEHLLRIKIPESTAAAAEGSAATATTAPGGKGRPAPAKKKLSTSIDLPLRVEIVYGCRAEAYFCTDFVSRGSCTLRMTESSKRALKAYEEKLRALVRLRLAAPQLIPRESSMNNNSAGGFPPPPRNCSGCGHPLQFRCTICGADVCGMPMCATNATVGYPRACIRHALPPNSAELAALLKTT